MHNIHIQLAHDPQHNAQALKEPIHSHAQHAVRRRGVVHPEDNLLIGRGGIGGSGKRAAHEGREFGVDGEGLRGGAGEVRGWEGDVQRAKPLVSLVHLVEWEEGKAHSVQGKSWGVVSFAMVGAFLDGWAAACGRLPGFGFESGIGVACRADARNVPRPRNVLLRARRDGDAALASIPGRHHAFIIVVPAKTNDGFMCCCCFAGGVLVL